MIDGIVVAIAGAASEVGREIATVLEERGVAVADLRLYDNTDEGTDADAGAFASTLLPGDAVAFDGVDIAFLCGPAAQTPELAERAIESGALVIDVSGALAALDVPLVVPEVNPDVVAEGIGRGVYACPGW